MNIRQRSQSTARNVEARDTSADDRQEDKAVDDIGQSILVSPSQRNYKRTADRARTIDEVRVVVRNAHAHQPNVQDEKEEDTPKDGHDHGLDCLARLDGLSSDDGNVLSRAKAKSRLHKGLGQTLHVGKGAGILPVAELDGSVGRFHTTGCHDKHVGNDNKDGQNLDPTHSVLDVAIHAHGEDVGRGRQHEEHGDVAGERDLLPSVPIFEHANGGCDLGGNDHDPLEPEVDALGEAKCWVDVFGGHADEAAMHGAVGCHFANRHVEDPDDESDKFDGIF